MADELLHLVLEGKKKATISVIKEGGDNTEGRVSILGIGWKRKALLRDQDSLLGVYEVLGAYLGQCKVGRGG